MSDAVLVAFIAGAPALLGAIGSLYTVIAMKSQTQTLKDQGDVIQKLEVNTNSMKDALIKVTGEAELAKGKLFGANNPEAATKPLVEL